MEGSSTEPSPGAQILSATSQPAKLYPIEHIVLINTMAVSKSSQSKRQYAALQPRILNVSRSAIKKRWTKLPEASQLRVKQLFRSVERSVMHKDGSAAADVQSIVDNIANILSRKVPRMPFPPKTDEASFDYEATLNRTRVLEAQLTGDLHSASLLKAEIKKERRLLEEDKEELQQLEKALRDEEARRQRHSKGLHPLAKIGETYTGRLRTAEEGPRLPCVTGPSFRNLGDDANLEDLLEQLHSHLESMQNNTGGIAEIPLAIATSQAALNSFLWRFLDKEKYSTLHCMDMT